MKKINTLVWVGLVINCFILAIAGFFYSLFPQPSDLYGVAFEEREMIQTFIFLLKPLFVSVALQIIGVLILTKSPKVGMTLAVLGSIIMLPISLIFMVGYFRSYETHTNATLTPVNNADPELSLTFNTSKISGLGALYIVVGIVIGLIGLSIGWLAFALGIVSLVNANRLKNKYLIAIEKGHLIITPSLYSQTYTVPLTDVHLIKDTASLFKLHIKSASVDKKCSYRKSLIKEENGPEILSAIFSQIATEPQ